MYTIKAVSKMLDIPAVTIRAWERRYDVINPSRTDGGQRLYTESDIEDLKWLKGQMDQYGISISQAAKLLLQKKTLPAVTSAHTPAADSDDNPYSSSITELYKELLGFNKENADRIVEQCFSLFHYREVFHRILTPVCYQVGVDWENGKATVAQEHFITSFVTERFYSIYKILPSNKQLPRVVAACPEGEYHVIGLLLYALFLREKGFEVILLGANTPLDGLKALIEEKQVHYICLSLSLDRHFDNALIMIRKLQEYFPAMKFILGGEGFRRLPLDLAHYLIGHDLKSWERWFKEIV
jgi:DNA-binding transcriptional MerR regulator